MGDLRMRMRLWGRAEIRIYNTSYRARVLPQGEGSRVEIEVELGWRL